MFQASTLQFLSDLKTNNNKPWFDTNRKTYEAAKADFAKLVQQLIDGTAAFDEGIATAQLQVKNCTFRINRDVRFSKDKSPYKSNMGASLNQGGKKINQAGYYFHCEPGGNSFAIGGIYMPMPPDLAKIRQEIDYNFAEWQGIVANETFKNTFSNGIEGIESLSRPPKGYDESNPAIEFLKMKSYICSIKLKDIDLQSDDLAKIVLKAFQTAKPLVDFLNRAI